MKSDDELKADEEAFITSVKASKEHLAKYLWLDLETTGLDPRSCKILECAAIVTDSELCELPAGFFEIVIASGENARTQANEFVRSMHDENGLWREAYASPFVEQDLLEGLSGLIGDFEWESKPVLAGATVHFDRGFLAEHVPGVMPLLGHRHLDVSSLKLAMGDVFGEPFAEANAHRAMADTRESLEQARQIYRRVSEMGLDVPH